MPSATHNEDLRQLEHVAPILFAFLLPYLTWGASLGMASAAVLYALVLSPRLFRSTRRPNEVGWGFSSGKLFYALAVLGLIALFRGESYIVVIVWANLAVGDAVSNVVGRRYGRTRLPWNREKSWIGMAAALVASSAAAYLLVAWVGFPPGWSLSTWQAVAHVITTSIVCSVAETLPLPLDDNLTLSIAGGAFLFWLSRAQSPRMLDASSLAIAIAISTAIGLAAAFARVLTPGGVGAGIALGSVVFFAFGWPGFALLGTFFVLGSAFSKIGYAEKAEIGGAQPDLGRRTARHVAGKGFAAGAAALAAIFLPDRGPAAIAFTAAVAAALADTTATEIGQLFTGDVILLKSFSRVPRGTPGGVSLAGSLAGLAAGIAIVSESHVLGLIGIAGAVAALVAATVAVHLESYLAARVAGTGDEGRSLPDDAWMNALHTTLAMLLAPLLARIPG